jgi:hypothetical protein
MARKPSTRHYADEFTCPVAGCTTSGSLPGLKRHMDKTHGIDWWDVETAKMNLQEGRLVDLMILDALRSVGLAKDWTHADLNTADAAILKSILQPVGAAKLVDIWMSKKAPAEVAQTSPAAATVQAQVAEAVA